MNELVLREVLTYGAGKHQFRPSDYPWLAAIGVHIKGGDGGRGSNGEPGGVGQWASALWLPDGPLEVTVTEGLPPTDPQGGQGEDGIVVLELYGQR